MCSSFLLSWRMVNYIEKSLLDNCRSKSTMCPIVVCRIILYIMQVMFMYFVCGCGYRIRCCWFVYLSTFIDISQSYYAACQYCNMKITEKNKQYQTTVCKHSVEINFNIMFKRISKSKYEKRYWTPFDFPMASLRDTFVLLNNAGNYGPNGPTGQNNVMWMVFTYIWAWHFG